MSSWRDRCVASLRLLASLAFAVWMLAIYFPALDTLSGGRLRDLGSWLGNTSARGFVVTASSDPSGGRLFVNGQDRGPTPALINVACTEGQEVLFRVEKPGYPPWERTVPCREGGSLKIRARLAS